MNKLASPLKNLTPRHRRWLRWSLGLLLAYAVIGFLIAPVVVRWVAVKQLRQLLGREVTIEKVRLNPFALSGTVRGFLIKDLDGEPFVSWDEAYANFQLSSFFGHPWVFREVTTTNPYVRVQINADYSLNFSDLIQRFSTKSTLASVPKSPARPPALRVHSLRVEGARASVTDRTLRQPFTRVIGPVKLNLENFHTDPSSKNPYAFAGRTDAGETFTWNGHFFLDPIRSGGELKVSGISLPHFAPVYQDLVRFELRNGVVDLAATYQIEMSATNRVMVVTNASFRLRTLQVAEPGADADVVQLGEASVTNASVDLVARRAEVASAYAAGAALWLRRDSNAAINFIELAKPSAQASNAPGSVLLLMQAVTNAFAELFASTNLWSATVHAVDVTNCAFTLDDHSLPRPVHLRLDDIALTARHLSNIPGSNLTAQVSLRWNTNGSIKAEVSAAAAPPQADVRLAVNQLELAPLDPYLAGFVNLFVLGSRLSVDATTKLHGVDGGLPQVTFNGDARLDGFATVDGVLTNDLLQWESVRVQDIAAQLNPPTIAIGQIEVLGLNARLAVETNQTINVFSALRLQATNTSAAAEPVAPSAAAPKTSLADTKRQLFGSLAESATGTNAGAVSALPKIAVNAIVISNAAIRLADHSLASPVNVSIHDVSGRISGLSTEDLRRGEIEMAGKVDRTGQFKLSGTLNPLNPDVPTQVAMTVSAVNLTPGSPYAGKFLGYQLSRGSVDLDVKYELTGLALKGANVIVLDQFTLGRQVESPDAVKLPIKLGLALLKDRNGRIELDVPIEGNLGDPEFRLRKVIFRAIGNIIAKTVASPFAALGSLLGGKSEEMSYVNFAPGSRELSTNATTKLATLAKALHERPGLELDIEGSFDPASDGVALRRQKLVDRFRELKWQALRKAAQEQIPADQVTLTSDEYASYVRAAYASALSAGTLTTNPPVAVSQPSATRAAPEKGAQALAKTASLAEAGVTLSQMEQQLMSITPIAEPELQSLAMDRAQRVQTYLSEQGKVELPRMFPLASGESSTNRLAQVQLRLK